MAGKRRRTAKNQGISKKAVFILGLFIALCVIGFAYMRQSGEEVITFSTDSAVATSTDADKTDKTERMTRPKSGKKGTNSRKR